jgi:hypothetical protein
MGEAISQKVIRKVARREKVEPTELEPLYTAINPDALDEIFVSGDHGGTVTFSYMDYEISVASSGEVAVNRPGA